LKIVKGFIVYLGKHGILVKLPSKFGPLWTLRNKVIRTHEHFVFVKVLFLLKQSLEKWGVRLRRKMRMLSLFLNNYQKVGFR